MTQAELNRKLLWLTSIRALVVASIVLSYLLYDLGQSVDKWQNVKFFVIYGAIQLLAHITLLRVLRSRPRIHAYLQFLGDLVLITLLIVKLEGASQFSLLYIVVIAVASVFLDRTGVLVIAGFAYVGYLGTVLNVGNLFSPEGGPVLTAGDAPADVLKLLYNLIMHLVGFYAVAILTSFLTRGVERARAELRATHLDLSYLEGLYGDVIESMSSGLLITDTTGMIVSINQTGEEILGRSQKDLEGTPIAEVGIFGPEEWERLRRRSGEAPMRDELRYRRDDGEEIVVGYSLSRFLDKEKSWRGYLLIFQDLTDWRELEEKVRQQDRLAAIGEMASKIAHEVGNPLASISGSVQMLAGRESDPQGQKLLEIILKESRRLDRTVKSFLEFAVLPERQPTEVDVAALLAEGVELLRNSEEMGAGHRIVADLVPDSVTLFADPDQIGQVFWNLARNAIQAMPDGGELQVVGRLDGDRYRIEFRDTGNGMTREERERLFLPFKSFFGRSLGLGMPIVSRIVEMHGGEIRVDSRPGRGTTITVELPTHPPAPANEEVATDAATAGR